MENIFFDTECLKIIESANKISSKLNDNEVSTFHLLYGIIKENSCEANKILRKLNLDFDLVTNIIKNKFTLGKEIIHQESKFYSSNSKLSLNGAGYEAKCRNCNSVNSIHLLLGLLHRSFFISAQLLNYYGISYQKIRNEYNKFSHFPVPSNFPPVNGKFVDHFYKFYSKDSFNIFESIVENEFIRYTQKPALNDKFDINVQINKFGLNSKLINENNKTKESIEETLKLFSNDLIENLGKDNLVNSIQNELQIVEKGMIDEIEKFDNELTSCINLAFEYSINNGIGVLCLTEDIGNSLMWAHYASNNQGFAIQFDINHKYFNSEIELQQIKAVYYDNNSYPIENFIDAISNNLEARLEYFFINKSMEWAYEKEWRMIKPLTDSIILPNKDLSNNNIHLLNIPRETITGIIFGTDTKQEEKEKMIEKTTNDKKYKHIIPYETYLNKKERKIEIKPIL